MNNSSRPALPKDVPLAKKLTCSVLAASMATLGIVPIAVAQPKAATSAENDRTVLYGEMQNPVSVKYHDRDCTFVDLDGGKTEGRTSTANDEQLFKQAVKTVLPNWASLGYNIMGYAIGDESKHFTFWDNAGKGWEKDFGKGHYIKYYEAMSGGNGATSSGDDCSSQSGLSVANKLSDVYTRMTDDTAALIHRNVRGEDFRNNVPMTTLTDNTKEQPVIYTTVQQVDRAGKTYHFYYNAFGIAFYDFKVHQLNTGEGCNAAPESSPEYDVADSETTDTFTTSNVNYSFDDSEVSVSLSNGTNESIGTTVTSSEEYSFGQSIGVEVSVSEGIKVPGIGTSEFSASYSEGLSASEVFSTAYSEQKTIDTNNCQTTTVTTVLPAHTVACTEQSLGTSHVYESYDQPVGITFKVSIFGINGELYDDNAAIMDMTSASYAHNSYCTTFGEDGSDAVENLYQRAVLNKGDSSYEQTHGQNVSWSSNDNWREITAIDWNQVLGDRTPPSDAGNAPNLSKVIGQMASTYPMSSLGARLSFESKDISTKLLGAQPIYPIEHIKVNYQTEKTKEMQVGDELPIQSYRVEALDKDYVPYYGFVASQGSWEVVDAKGSKCSSKVIKIAHDPVTKEQVVTALSPGEAYVKYFIPEKTYVYAYGHVSTNKDIESAAYKIKVVEPEKEAFDGSIAVEGSPQVTVGEKQNLNAMENLSYTVYNSSGKEVDKSVSWEAQELENKGIKVDADGSVSCSKEGAFHVRAYIDDVYSDWIELTAVNAAPEPEATVVEDEPAKLSDEEQQSLLSIAGDVYSYGVDHGYITGDAEKGFAEDDYCAMYAIYEIAQLKGLVSDEEAKAVKDYVEANYTQKQVDKFKQQVFGILLEKGYIPEGITTNGTSLDVEALKAKAEQAGKSDKEKK